MSFRDDRKQDLDNFTDPVKQSIENLKNIPENISDTIYDATHKQNDDEPPKKSKVLHVIWTLIKTVILIAAVVVLLTYGRLPIFNKTLPRDDTPDTPVYEDIDDVISMVQNGYLGQYTDVTVRQILDTNYDAFYDHTEWDGGTTDSGDVIVEVQYRNESGAKDSVTIQFTMLTEECFKLSGFADTLHPLEENTDLLATMNYNYLIAYIGLHRNQVYNDQFERDLISRLSVIPSSDVVYGASAAYEGDRARLHELAGDDTLDVSVAMLLDHYGLFDLSYYVEESTAPTEAPTAPPTEAHISTQDLLQTMYRVMSCQEEFFMSDTGEPEVILGITNIAGDHFEYPLDPIMFTCVDCDGDGQEEVIVELTDNRDGWRLVLDYQDGMVYGYGFYFRALNGISADGYITASSGASSTDVFTFSFDRGFYDTYVLSPSEASSVLNNWEDAVWFDYTDEYLDFVFSIYAD